MSDSAYDDWMPCSVVECQKRAHHWDYDPPDDGEFVIRTYAMENGRTRSLPSLVVYLCDEHRGLYEPIIIEQVAV